MKCKAREILRNQQERAAEDEYLLVSLEFVDVELARVLMDVHGWRKKRLKWMFDVQRTWTSDWIEKYASNGGKIKDRHKGYRDMTADELWSKNVEMAQSLTDDYLASIGFEYKFTDMIPDNLRHGGWRRDQIKGTRRALWYAVYGERMIRLYVTSLFKLLHDERGFGAGRLRGVFDLLAERIRWYVGRFFVGSERTDKEIRARVDEGHSLIEKLGIELIDFPAKTVETAKKKPVPRQVPAGLEALTWDKLKDVNFDTMRKVL